MRRTLLFIACVLTSLAMQAQENAGDYRPLVEEGKHWTYDNFMPLRPAKYDHYYYYDLKGDTLIAGKKCLKMYSDNVYNDSIIHYEGALYEENKKVFCFFPGKEEAVLLYNFDCKIGDLLDIYYGDEQVLVTDIQSVALGDTIGRQYILQPVETFKYDGEMMYWIEGVGSTKDFFGMKPAVGNNRYLDACELNGEYLYKMPVPDTTPKDYHKMGIEGKRWNYIHYYLDENGEHREPYSYVVRGDTVIRRTPYKKLWYQDGKTERLVCLLLEEGRGVYKSTDFGNNSYESPVFKTFFEFDRTDFGRVFSWKSKCQEGNTNWMVYGVDTIMVKNRQFRRYTCLQQYSDEGETLTTIPYDGKGVWRDIWVEGVGSASSGIEDQIPLHEPPLKTTSDYTYFVSCYEDGACIFTSDDFNIQQDVNIAYRPMIEDGKVWKVGCIDADPSQFQFPVKVVNYYYFDGDTIIDGKTCKQMMSQQYVSPESLVNELHYSLSYAGAWYEEDKKVYTYDEDNKEFKLMYDFSVNDNDTLQVVYFGHELRYAIGQRQTGGLRGFKGVYRNVSWIDATGVVSYSPIWMEGVGSIDGPTMNLYKVDIDPLWALMSCSVDDEVIYLNDNYVDVATPEALIAEKRRFDFTHTIKTRPKAPLHRLAEASETTSLYGEYSDQRLGINLNPLDQAYLVSITDMSGRAVYEKTIDAGTIVALDIDISAYPKGHYTVTVENSNEVFTGEFDSQTEGIEVVSNKKTEGANIIFNLQGQRISSLQKGLNIVNGQKVCVK